MALLLVCLICHCELAALKPGPQHLTSYFLSMSLGGALGGIFVNLVAPYVFNTFFEMPLAFLASIAAIAGWLLCPSAAGSAGRPRRAVAAGHCRGPGWRSSIGRSSSDAESRIPTPARHDLSRPQLLRPRERAASLAQRARVGRTMPSAAATSRTASNYADPARRSDTDVCAYWGPDTGCRAGAELQDQAAAQLPDRRRRPRRRARSPPTPRKATTSASTRSTRRSRTSPTRYFHFLKDCKAPVRHRARRRPAASSSRS